MTVPLFSGSEDLYGTFCPFVGKFSLIYEPNPEPKLCHQLSNCEGSNEMTIKTFDCDSEIPQNSKSSQDPVRASKFQCVGHWTSQFPGKQFAILKTENNYKCAVSLTILEAKRY